MYVVVTSQYQWSTWSTDTFTKPDIITDPNFVKLSSPDVILTLPPNSKMHISSTNITNLPRVIIIVYILHIYYTIIILMKIDIRYYV